MYLYPTLMKFTMKAAFVKDSSSVVVEDVEKPILGTGDVLVKMHACGICGSDLEKVFGKYSQPSTRLGHEPSGTIEKVGENVTYFKKGDRVYVNHGGILKIPDSMSFEEAAMIEPLACCIRAWDKFSFQKGDSAAIFGVGATGMMHVMLSIVHEFDKIFCIDVNEFRLEFAKKFNITDAIKSSVPDIKQKILDQTDNRGVDVAIVATGSLQALSSAIDLVRKGGTVVMFGVPSKDAMINLNMSVIYSKEITMISSYAASDSDTNAALELIQSSKIDVKKLITHRYNIKDSPKAFEHAHHGVDSMKIIITN